ncbi:N-6 DNA methylase [Sinorhizobium medicae]|nr:N-6 DNA methylase [Sinorhizobium medicae]
MSVMKKPATISVEFDSYSEQDTADKLILPYLAQAHGFPKAESLDYQAQHVLETADGKSGRYDGLYLSGGYPYAVMEAKRHSHELDGSDFQQARQYATSSFFDKPVPFIVLSNGRDHQFFQLTGTLSPADQKPIYNRIPAVDWAKIILHDPGEVKQLLTQEQLLAYLRTFKQRTYNDISALFIDPASGKLDLSRNALGSELLQIIEDRKNFIGTAAKGEVAIRHAIQAVALHFTIKILFIKLIEDLARGPETPRIIHTLFPNRDYDQIGGLFGFKVLNAIKGHDRRDGLKLFVRSRNYYKKLGQDLARVSWQDIFRYGFNVHMERYGQLFSARHYDRFLPSDLTLQSIRQELIRIDIRTAIIYGSASDRTNVIGNLYERLIDDELRSSLGAVYTPDETMSFMVDLGQRAIGHFRGCKVVEPACGSGHFYRELYRRYVAEVRAHSESLGISFDPGGAHAEALRHIYGRDIDPFAVQLTLLSTFLEQLKDNVRPGQGASAGKHRWLADRSIDTQNSLDPITIDPVRFFDIEKTADLTTARSRKASCERAASPDLLIGNPPYGVSVVKGAHYDDIYSLRSADSYGYFIANAIARLPEGRRMIYIVSSSFLTIGSHKPLRELILSTCKVVRIIKLHRATFPGIDIFPCIVELEKCGDSAQRSSNVYQFYDLWRLHPTTHATELKSAYAAILDDLAAAKKWPFDDVLAKRYTVRQGHLGRYARQPIFEGLASLYDFMADVPANADTIDLARADGSKLSARYLALRGRKVVKLHDIASVKIGLQSGDNGRFYRVAPGVKGGAQKGGYKQVNPSQVVSETALASMTPMQKLAGFEVNDPTNDAFYVPLDKAGEADIEGGLLASFWRPIEFYIDWSEQGVAAMKKLHGKSGVFRNPQYYFKRGISFSNTGIYSPSFRLSHGGVFDQKGSNIFCDVIEQKVLLGILSSTLLRYFVKAFINHGVDAQLDDLPIVIPTTEEKTVIANIVDGIVTEQKADASFDYRPKLRELDEVVYKLYQLTPNEMQEVSSWYRRHYPKLTGDGSEES